MVNVGISISSLALDNGFPELPFSRDIFHVLVDISLQLYDRQRVKIASPHHQISRLRMRRIVC